MNALTILIAINTCLAVIYAVVKCATHQASKGITLGIFFICVPVIGFIYYFVPDAIQTFLNRRGVDRDEILPHQMEVEHQPEHPNVRAELNVVPIEDAMAISSNAEKRSLILSQMEKDWQNNFKSLLVAGSDDDSETAHYAAAEKMGIYRIEQDRWLEVSKRYEKDPDNPQYFHLACAVLADIFDSEVFPQLEQTVYRKRLCEIVQHELDVHPNVVTPEECEACLHAMVEIGDYSEAESFWAEYAGKMQSEEAYRDMLKIYYQTNDFSRFAATLDELRNNENIRLSPQGLSDVRYWTNRLGMQERTASEPAVLTRMEG